LNIGLGGSYATWAGTVLDRDKPIVIIAEPGRQEEAAMRLGRIGFDSVVGYLRDGISSLESRTDLMTGTTRVTPAEAAGALASSTPPMIVDVRAPREWQKSHIEGSVNIPLNHLAERIEEVPTNRPVLVHCAGSYRSSIAAGILQARGRHNLTELNGGLVAWEAAGLPVIS
jgi:rhodanese-related sulfurtransferase